MSQGTVNQIIRGVSQKLIGKVTYNPGVPTLRSAEISADILRDLEAQHAGDLGPYFEQCIQAGRGAIMDSFAAIVAAIAEIERELDETASQIKKRGSNGALLHAQALLALRGMPGFDKDDPVFKSAQLLRDLRTELEHPRQKPDQTQRKNAELSKRIVDAGLGRSPFQPDPAFAFPYGCMSAAVADWAASTARQFIRELRSRLGLPATV